MSKKTTTATTKFIQLSLSSLEEKVKYRRRTTINAKYLVEKVLSGITCFLALCLKEKIFQNNDDDDDDDDDNNNNDIIIIIIIIIEQ